MLVSNCHVYTTFLRACPFALPHPNCKWRLLTDNNMGKVHGSLARAGKVKSQTPKVEQIEKPKAPTGRAKKRVLYTRRCVSSC